MLGLVLLIFGLALYVIWTKTSQHGIPGPMGWPIVGSLLSLDPADPQKQVAKWAQKYGSVFSVRLGSTNTVFLTDGKLIKEVFNKTEASSRPDTAIFTKVQKGHYGLFGSNGELWAENRRFTLKYLHDVGMDRSVMENVINNEIDEFIEEHLDTKNYDIVELDFQWAITSIIWNVVAGERLPRSDPTFIELLSDASKCMEVIGNAILTDHMPWAAKILPKSYNDLDYLDSYSDKFVYGHGGKVVRKHQETFNADHMRDYVDMYLQQIARQKDNPHSSYFEWQLLQNLDDLLVGGQESTSMTLLWAFSYLCQHPDVQTKVQDEIDRLVGSSGRPYYAEREKMPYTMAMIYETQRCADLLPLGVPRLVTSDITAAGYTIKKGTEVIAAIGLPSKDPKRWKCPNHFEPLNFLDDNGRLENHTDYFMPFSAGKRSCVGKSLAEMELFLFITNLLQRFCFRFPSDHVYNEGDDGSGRVVRRPKRYSVHFNPRY